MLCELSLPATEATGGGSMCLLGLMVKCSCLEGRVVARQQIHRKYAALCAAAVLWMTLGNAELVARPGFLTSEFLE